jgi:FAD/FMN-containing dehydrogenase
VGFLALPPWPGICWMSASLWMARRLYVNYPDVDLVDWQRLYYKDSYDQLQQVKQRWDPHHVFNHRQSIELPG